MPHTRFKVLDDFDEPWSVAKLTGGLATTFDAIRYHLPITATLELLANGAPKVRLNLAMTLGKEYTVRSPSLDEQLKRAHYRGMIEHLIVPETLWSIAMATSILGHDIDAEKIEKNIRRLPSPYAPHGPWTSVAHYSSAYCFESAISFPARPSWQDVVRFLREALPVAPCKLQLYR